MPEQRSSDLRYAEFLREHPKVVGSVGGLISGLLFAGGMSLLPVLLPVPLDSVPGPTSMGGMALFGLVMGVPFGVIMGVLCAFALRRALPPPFDTRDPRINRDRRRHAFHLVRRGQAAADPDLARLAVWQARQTLRWRGANRWLVWFTSPVYQGVLSVVMTLLWGWLLVDSLLRAAGTAQTLFWGAATLLGLLMLGNACWMGRFYGRARSALEANTAVVRTHDANRADRETPGAM